MALFSLERGKFQNLVYFLIVYARVELAKFMSDNSIEKMVHLPTL
jgi:hypothetical protein